MPEYKTMNGSSPKNHDNRIPDKIRHQAEEICREARKAVAGYQQTGDNAQLAAALELYQKASVIFPDQSEPYIAIAFICMSCGRDAEAKTLLKRALEIEPFNFHAGKMFSRLSGKPDTKVSEKQPAEAGRQVSSPSPSPAFKPGSYQKEALSKKIQERFNNSKVKITVNEKTLSRFSELTSEKVHARETESHEPVVTQAEQPNQEEKQTKVSFPNAPEKIVVRVADKTLHMLSDNVKTNPDPIFKLFDD